jgi:haloacetate dehalogenase
MAQDMVALMASLGHNRFTVAGHDRGGRVAYRLALDHPRALSGLAVLDIVPTYEMWHNFSVALAMKTYHWLFLAQPNPLPEMLIERQPIAFLDYTLASWTKTKNLSAFDEAALAEYRLHYATPEHVHATCNDYRAGATCDLADDEADRAAGRKIACPVLALWGEAGFPAHVADPATVWRGWARDVVGHRIDSGHFVAEENPQQTLAHLLPFLKAHGH